MPDAVALGDGIKWWKTVIPLYRLGWVATPVFTREHPEHKEENDWPNSDAIKCLIIGRKAIVSYIDDDKTVGAHSLAWNGKELIDCNDCLIVDIDSIIIIEALMLGKSLTSDG